MQAGDSEVHRSGAGARTWSCCAPGCSLQWHKAQCGHCSWPWTEEQTKVQIWVLRKGDASVSNDAHCCSRSAPERLFCEGKPNTAPHVSATGLGFGTVLVASLLEKSPGSGAEIVTICSHLCYCFWAILLLFNFHIVRCGYIKPCCVIHSRQLRIIQSQNWKYILSFNLARK